MRVALCYNSGMDPSTPGLRAPAPQAIGTRSAGHFTAEEIHEAELTSLNGEFARIMATDALLIALDSAPERAADSALGV